MVLWQSTSHRSKRTRSFTPDLAPSSDSVRAAVKRARKEGSSSQIRGDHGIDSPSDSNDSEYSLSEDNELEFPYVSMRKKKDGSQYIFVPRQRVTSTDENEDDIFRYIDQYVAASS